MNTPFVIHLKKYADLIIEIVVAFILIVLWMWDIRQGLNDNRMIQQQELTEIKATLSNKPAIETAEQGGSWVPIKLKEYPGFNFDVSGVKYPALKAKDFINAVSVGDSITLNILTYDYATKLKKEKALRPSESLINYKFIEPYSIQAGNKIYMTLADVNYAWEDNNKISSWLLYWISGSGVFVGLVWMILYFTGFTKRFKKWLNEIQANH